MNDKAMKEADVYRILMHEDNEFVEVELTDGTSFIGSPSHTDEDLGENEDETGITFDVFINGKPYYRGVAFSQFKNITALNPIEYYRKMKEYDKQTE